MRYPPEIGAAAVGITCTSRSQCLTVSSATGHLKLKQGLSSLHQKPLLHKRCQSPPGSFTWTFPVQDVLEARVASRGTTWSGSCVEVAWGLQEVSHQGEFGECFCRRLCGLESLPAQAFLSLLLCNSSLIGLVSLRKPGRTVQKEKGFKSCYAGSDESWLCLESLW